MNGLPLLVRHYLRLIYRDRNTKLYGVLLPLVLYPAMLFLAGQGRLVLAGLEQARPSRVLLALPHEDPAHRFLESAPGASLDRLRLLAQTTADREAARQALARGEVEAALARAAAGGPLLLLRREGEAASRRAAARVRALCASLMADSGTPPPPLLEVEVQSTSPEVLRALLARILPMIVLVMAALGALHPAVEVTAGERERYTAETTLLLPVPVGRITAARFLAVGLAAGGAVLLNLAGMILAAGPLFGGQGELLAGIPPSALALAGLFALLLALFFGAALLLACTPARTFREAQTFATPLTLLAFLPGLAPLLPGLEFDLAGASLPIVNGALALRGLLEGTARGAPLLLAAGQLVLLTITLALVAARLQNRPRLALGPALDPDAMRQEGNGAP